MSRRIRIIYFIGALAIFLVIAPLLLIYANGWRYDYTSHSIKKVGGIIIETNPKGAGVLLNNKDITKKTPCTITNLTPGKYSVEIQKDGYFAWKKQSTVSSGITNRLTDITLLKNSPVISPLAEYQLAGASLASNDTYTAIYGDQQPIIVVSNPDGHTVYRSNNPMSVTAWKWANENNQALLQTSDAAWHILTIGTTTTLQDFSQLYTGTITNAFWSIDEANIVYAQTAAGLLRLNIFQKTSTVLNNGAHIGFVANNLLFQETDTYLNITSLDNLTKLQIPILSGHHLAYFGSLNNYIFILDTTHEFLYVYDFQTNSFEKLPQAVTGLELDNKTGKILIYNRFELWSWDSTQNKQTLIVRTSDTIDRAFWLRNNAYIAVLHNQGTVQFMEATNTDRNTYDVPVTDSTYIYGMSDGSGVILTKNQQLFYIPG